MFIPSANNKEQESLIIEKFQIASIPGPWQLLAFIILKPKSPIAQYKDDSIGSLPIRAKLSLSEIFLVADDFSQDEVTDLKLPCVALFIISSSKLLLVYRQLNCNSLLSFF